MGATPTWTVWNPALAEHWLGARGKAADVRSGKTAAETRLRADRLGDVAERVDGRTPDGLLRRPQHVEQVEADPHPLAIRHHLRATVRDAADQVDAVLLHLLVPVLEDGGEARQEVLDGRVHLLQGARRRVRGLMHRAAAADSNQRVERTSGHPPAPRLHAQHVDDALECAKDRPEDVGVLLSQVLEQHLAQVLQQLALPAGVHHRGDPGNQVRRLLADLGVLVVEPPLDGAADLREVGLGAKLEAVDDRCEAVEDDHVALVRRLLLERVEDAVHELLLQPAAQRGGKEKGRTWVLDRGRLQEEGFEQEGAG